MLSVVIFMCSFISILAMPLVDDKKPLKKECEQTIIGDFGNPQMEVLEVPATCSRGIVNYHYTTSPIEIAFRKRGIYIVCITSKAMPGWEHFSVEDLTARRNEFLGAPSKKRQICAFTTNGNLNLRIEPKNLSYMLQVPYILIDFNFPLKPVSSLTSSKNV